MIFQIIGCIFVHLMNLKQRIFDFNRSDIINFLIKKNKYKKYLEIGCDYNLNFNRINIDTKVGIDPVRGGTLKMTSDDFFKQNKETFDIIFIDGLHYADQVYKDIINSIKILNKNGTIVVHDCNPLSYDAQFIPQPRWERHWNGNIWKTWLRFRSEWNDLEMFVVDADEGVGVIKNGKQKTIKKWDISYKEFYQNKKQLLNLISVENFKRNKKVL